MCKLVNMLANWLTALLLAIRFPLIWVWISNPGRIAAHRATNSAVRSTHLLDVTQALFLGGELYVDLSDVGRSDVGRSDVDGFTPNSASFAKATASSTLTSSMRLQNSLSLSSGGTADCSIASRACICPRTVINPSILRWLFIREILTPSLD